MFRYGGDVTGARKQLGRQSQGMFVGYQVSSNFRGGQSRSAHYPASDRFCIAACSSLDISGARTPAAILE
jgi:hypothetical protein